MNLFIVGICLVLVVVAGLMISPVLRQVTLSMRVKVLTLGLAISALIVGVGGLYLKTSNYEWDDAKRASANGQVSPEVRAMVDRLEEKLTTNPHDVTGWLLLGRSRMALGQYPLAQMAFTHADEAASHQNADALVGLAVAVLVQANDNQPFPGSASKALEAALLINPSQPDALYYGGVAARESGQLAIARSRWLTLLKQHPSDDVRQAVIDNIHSVDLAQGLAHDPELDVLVASTPSSASSVASAAVSAPAQSSTAQPDEPLVREPAKAYVITVKLALDPRLITQLPKNGFILISAKPEHAVGPPWLARKIRLSQLPLTMQLSERDALMGNHSLSSLTHIEVSARITASGDAMTHPGDLIGRVSYSLTNTQVATPISIDHVAP